MLMSATELNFLTAATIANAECPCRLRSLRHDITGAKFNKAQYKKVPLECQLSV